MRRKSKKYLGPGDGMMAAVGSLLRAGRLRSGLTQAQVSRRSGVPQRTISEWESGYHDPPFLGAWKVAQALGMSILELVPSEWRETRDKPRRGRPSSQEIAEAFRGKNSAAAEPG